MSNFVDYYEYAKLATAAYVDLDPEKPAFCRAAY